MFCGATMCLQLLFLSANHVFHSRSKHIEVDYHFDHDLSIRFVSGEDNFADLFTKPLATPSFVL